MIKPDLLDDLARRLGDMLPPGLDRLQEDFRRNARGAMEAALARMDLVTREEFDVQAAVLARTREKLDALAVRVTEMEGTTTAGETSSASGSAD